MQNGRLLGCELFNRLGGLAPFQIRVAPQGAQAGTRRVHQHPVNLAGQALDALITLVGNGDRVDIGQAAACQPRFEGVESMARGVKRIKASGIAHGGAKGQGLAAGTGTKIHHHLAAFGIKQQGQQLGALVLHLNGAARERVQLVQRRLAGQPQAPGGVRRCDGFNSCLGKLLLHFGAFVLQGVDAQVQTRRRIEAFDQGPEVITKLRLQRVNQPLRQVVAVQLQQIRRFDLVATRQPIFFRLGKRTQQELALRGKAQNRQPPLGWPAAVLGKIGVEVFLAQDTVHRFGQGGPLAGAEALLTKITRYHHVGGVFKFKNLLEKLGTTVE